MSDKMIPIPFDRLMNWILDEFQENGEIFGIRKFAPKINKDKLPLFNELLEYPFGPAAGPHTQLAQNIIASYVAGGRFFELKTVQFLDGEDLPVSKPCILVPDEGYNVEWSTELYVPQALDEYIKAWFALKLLSQELDLGDPEGFIFNMSVGYDLEGIKTNKIDSFIEGLKDAENTKIWEVCKNWAVDNLTRFKNVDKAYINDITPKVCNSITLSTLHGCPPDEIERIATYLITEKKLNTFIKCNPTLLGYEYARKTLDSLGFDYLVFDDHHFKADLQFEDAVPMLHKLKELASANNLSFGVKLTNTFPVKITEGELPGQEMYMSGRSLYPLSIALANKLSQEFNGQLQISYSGGADIHNIAQLFEAGIWPITIATTLLKPGGYNRMFQMAEQLSQMPYKPFIGVDLPKVQALVDNIPSNSLYKKTFKLMQDNKLTGKAPILDCYDAPCMHGCPFGQDIPAYLRLAGEGKYFEALQVITQRNPLPFITGSICPHHCTNKCTRSFYEEAVHIREIKKESAVKAFEQLMATIKAPKKSGGSVAVIGGGPAGLAVAYFLAKAGRPVTIFEKRNSLGGIVRHVIPEFRISHKDIDNDIAIISAFGIEVKLNTEITSLNQLSNFDTVVVAVGAWNPGILKLEEGEALGVLEFLENAKSTLVSDSYVNATVKLGENVVVVGGGNTAMDAARTAKRMDGVKNVSIVYRRTKLYMPADDEEFQLAMEENIEFCELLAPKSLKDGKLSCIKMKLGESDASGRRSPVPTDELINIPANTVISAIGDKVDYGYLEALGFPIEKNSTVTINSETYETLVENVYLIGDAVAGPATIAKAIRDAIICAEAITKKRINTEEPNIEEGISAEGINIEGTGKEHYDVDKYADLKLNSNISAVINKKGLVYTDVKDLCSPDRCLECATVCENCVDVCPNRANVVVMFDGRRQVIHMDALCNECGNCEVFCPYSGAPYKDKFTYFSHKEDFEQSTNPGFFVLKDDPTGNIRSISDKRVYVRTDGLVQECRVDAADKIVQTILKNGSVSLITLQKTAILLSSEI